MYLFRTLHLLRGSYVILRESFRSPLTEDIINRVGGSFASHFFYDTTENMTGEFTASFAYLSTNFRAIGHPAQSSRTDRFAKRTQALFSYCTENIGRNIGYDLIGNLLRHAVFRNGIGFLPLRQTFLSLSPERN